MVPPNEHTEYYTEYIRASRHVELGGGRGVVRRGGREFVGVRAAGGVCVRVHSAGRRSAWLRRGACLDQAALVGDDDELGAVARGELEQDAADVCLGGRAADDEPFGDLLVA